MNKPISFQKHENLRTEYQRGEQIGRIVGEALKAQETELDRLRNQIRYKLDLIEPGITSAYMLSERAIGYMVSNDIPEDNTQELWCYVNSVNAILNLLEEIITMPD